MFMYLYLCVHFAVENSVLVIPILTAIPCLVPLHLNLMNKSVKFSDLWLLIFSGRDWNNGIAVLQILKCTSLSPRPLLEELRIGWFGFLWQFTFLFSLIFNIFGNFSFTFCLNLLAPFVAEVFFFLTILVLPLRVDLQNAVTSHYFKNFHNWTKLNLCSNVSLTSWIFIMAFKILIPFIHSLNLIKIYWAVTVLQEIYEILKM